MRKNLLKIFWIILLVISFGGILILSINWNSKKSYKKINFSNLVSLKENELMKYFDSSFYNLSKSEIKFTKIKEKLLSEEMIDDLVISSGNNDELNIKIFEKIPIAYVITNQDHFFIDKNKNLLNNNLHEYYPDLPIIRIDNINKDTNNLKLCVEFINNIKNIQYLISEIYFENDELNANISFNGVKLKLGNYSSSISNFNKFYNFINSLKNLNFSNISFIDTRWDNQIVIKELNN